MNNFSYKGQNKSKNYFEGWYLRVVDESNNSSYVFIFGISLYKKDPHAFIQMIDSKDENPYYFRYDIKDFYYNNESIMIKDNVLGLHELKIKEGLFDINLKIKPTVELKSCLFTKSAMGFMRCLPLPTYHEIVFMDAKAEGTMSGENLHGIAYMEKNWGSCFPKEWLWLQTNHFTNYNASLTLAIADVIGTTKAFFCILNVDGDEFRFATYNCFKIDLSFNNDSTKIIIYKKETRLIIEVKQEKGHTIIAPLKKGEMKKEIEESLTSTLTIDLYKDGEHIFSDKATNVSCENLYYNATQHKEKTI